MTHESASEPIQPQVPGNRCLSILTALVANLVSESWPPPPDQAPRSFAVAPVLAKNRNPLDSHARALPESHEVQPYRNPPADRKVE